MTRGHLMILNALDALLSLVAFEQGVGEVNPVMALALSLGIMPFLVIKFTAVVVAVEYLDRKLTGRRRWVLMALAVVLYAVIGWHVWGLLSIR
jgi:hypothetical protein